MAEGPGNRWPQVQRAILGVIAVLTSVAAVWLNFIDKGLGERNQMIAAGCLRMAPILIVLWLALPEARRGWRAWLVVAAVLVGASLMFRGGKRGLWVLIPALSLLAALGFLRRFTAGFQSPSDAPPRAPRKQRDD